MREVEKCVIQGISEITLFTKIAGSAEKPVH
jgi:hypothetical protein